ncbi:hypothetical protein [Pseudomonas sp. SBB6]|uniref:hypothetical protein n=1 Tax=Pseudomonas sp. SBB6 TaxID=2962032 RepID=UPI0020B82337|nr:hypothetical protein [Pseudomonas sp. SBB6]MCP3751649.1 hypothetical protein [Pseudomonas sp. SBB6]
MAKQPHLRIRWNAKCPVIMGGYYAYQLIALGKGNLRPSLVIDLCAFSDKGKVQKGAEVALKLLGYHRPEQDVVMPVFCDPTCSLMLPQAIYDEERRHA